tara:strand:+ start:328 stop:1518 length:1191 start_codon:yes stop_codon:yes gene_type:complete
MGQASTRPESAKRDTMPDKVNKRTPKLNAFKEYMRNAQISDMYGDKRLFVELYGRLLAEDDFQHARGNFKEVVLGTKELAFTCPNKNGGYECVYSVERVVIDKKDGGRKRAKQIANSKFKQWRKFKDLENQSVLSNYILVADEMAINNWDKDAECWIVCKLQKCISSNKYDLTTVCQLATGLKLLYENEVYFSDIKPDNILFCDGRWKFIDVDNLIVGWDARNIPLQRTLIYLPTGWDVQAYNRKHKKHRLLKKLYREIEDDPKLQIEKLKIDKKIKALKRDLDDSFKELRIRGNSIYLYAIENKINFLECNVYTLCVSLSEMLTDTFDDIEKIKENIVKHVNSRKQTIVGGYVYTSEKGDILKSNEATWLGYLDTLIGLSPSMPLAGRPGLSLKF